MGNSIKTTVLLALMTGLFVTIGQALGGQSGMVMALVIACGMNGVMYWFSDRIVLKMQRATLATSDTHPELLAMVTRLAANADLPVPKVYIIPDYTPNAFATGRSPSHSAVAFTQGILNLLTPAELSGVAAHELAHIKHYDTLISTISACLAGAVSMLANMAQWAMIFGGRRSENEGEGGMASGLLTVLIAPIAATLIQMAISRSREYVADEAGGRIHGNPLDLASALLRIHDRMETVLPEPGNPALAHLYIMSPLSARGGGGLLSMFSSHPPVEERVRRLKLQSV